MLRRLAVTTGHQRCRVASDTRPHAACQNEALRWFVVRTDSGCTPAQLPSRYVKTDLSVASHARRNGGKPIASQQSIHQSTH